jgi:hypothetical protein
MIQNIIDWCIEATRMVLWNQRSQGRTGRVVVEMGMCASSFFFFPVDNTKGRDDPSIVAQKEVYSIHTNTSSNDSIQSF